MLLKGNCLETLKSLPDNSIDAVVTDPPYELGFMGKSWDSTGIAYNVEVWKECLRVLKPGGHLLAFGGSRTYHRLACAVEDAGFEIRDQIMWIYGSGFPKSLDVSKAIDKSAGAEREVVGKKITRKANAPRSEGRNHIDCASGQMEVSITAPATAEDQRCQGWGTALKPAHEPIVVARKPLIGTVANNILTYGTGALNIDGSRVGLQDGEIKVGGFGNGGIGFGGGDASGVEWQKDTKGRWPANVIHDGSEEVLAGFPDAKGGTWNPTAGARHFNNDGEPTLYKTSKSDASEGSAGRFFYCAKASKAERNAGLEGLPEQMLTGRDEGQDAMQVPYKTRSKVTANFHPTVKPLALMRYLIKLVTPPNGTVLDPFLGSGTTAVAAVLEGCEWIGCELTPDYHPIIEARVEWAKSQVEQQTLF